MTEKVSFNIANEAIHFYILFGQKLIKTTKVINFAEFLKNWSSRLTVLPDRSFLIGQKLLENAKIKKFKWDMLRISQTF